MALGSRLKQLLNDRNITVKEFAKKIDVAPTTLYSFIKRDSSDGKLDLIYKIATGLGMRVDEFLSYSDPELGTVLDLTPFDTVEQINATLKIIEKQKKDNQHTIAAHFDGDEYTEEEINKIKEFAEFIKSQRKTKSPDKPTE